MRVEIHRTRMVTPRGTPGSIVTCDLRVPTETLDGLDPYCHRTLTTPHELESSGDRRLIEYVNFDVATWRPAMERGWDRWGAWLAHEQAARKLARRIILETCLYTVNPLWKSWDWFEIVNGRRKLTNSRHSSA